MPATLASSPESLEALDGAIAVGMSLFTPPPPLTLSEWADRYAYLPRETSALPGKFQTATAEYQRGIMDAITDPEVETVVMMMASQTGKTQIQLNAIGYYSHHDPSPIMVMQATLDEAEKFSKNRIAKMIRDTPVLAGIYPDPKARDSGNTLLNKEFIGGVLTIAGANSPAALASKPIRILMPDEVDRYPESAGTEGDPVDLAEKRTTTFYNRKKILASTPNIKQVSRIDAAMESSDQRRYFVPCPHCGEMQILEWGRLRYKTEGEGNQKRPVEWCYACVSGCEILEPAKFDMIRLGEWRATGQSRDGRTAGFQLNALYSPMIDWKMLILERIEAEHSVERLKTFVNTRLAETWEVRGEGADKGELEGRREAYESDVPMSAVVLTAGVDAQKDRIEVCIYGHGVDGEKWAIDHKIIRGDTSLPEAHEKSPWRELGEYLQTDWHHASGVFLRVACTLVDSGFQTKLVYDFCKKRELQRIFACKGDHNTIGRPMVSRGTRVGPKKTLLFMVGGATAKERIYTSLRVTERGPGFIHYPERECFDGEFYRQLTSEQLVTRVNPRTNQTTMRWVKKYERNEALDMTVYAFAALDVLKPNLAAIKASLVRRGESVAVQREQEEKPEPQTQAKPAMQKPQRTSLKNALNNPWVNAWRR